MDLRTALIETFDMDLEADNNEITMLEELAHVKEISKGEVFIQEGNVAEYFYLIGKGKAVIKTPEPELKIYTAGPMEVVGWSSMVEPRLYMGRAEALEDMVLVRFDARELLLKMSAYPRLGYLVMFRVSQFLSQRLLHSVFELLSEHVALEESQKQLSS